LAQQDLLEKETSQQPFIGEKEPLTTLIEEYQNANGFREKIQNLTQKYSSIRRVRRDGNCFYRAFLFSYLNHLLEFKNKEEISRILKFIQESFPMLLNLGYPEISIESFYEILLEQIELIRDDKHNSKTLLESFCDYGISNALVVYMRLLTALSLQQNEELYSPFLENGQTIKQFCSSEVEPMAKEADHLKIDALTKIFDIGLALEYLDLSPGNVCKFHQFLPDKPQKVVMLYRPGHYDIIYPSS